ncbi:hypothetical protein Tco_1238164 [Tanacetum coccineum]
MFIIDLIPLGHGSFDVIIGMEWLSKNKAVIVCHEKVVEIPITKLNEEYFEFNGTYLGVAKAYERREALMNKLSEDSPLVRDFELCSRKDLSRFPQRNDYKLIEMLSFVIDLVPGGRPGCEVSISSSTSKMQELVHWAALELPTWVSYDQVTTDVFIANFSKIAKPLTSLTQKNKKYEWGVEQEEAFQTLKNNLCDAPILSLPNGVEDLSVSCEIESVD